MHTYVCTYSSLSRYIQTRETDMYLFVYMVFIWSNNGVKARLEGWGGLGRDGMGARVW